MNESIQIINSVELIPLEDTEVNPFLTRVRIKVFHLGENRNHSFIDKPTALNMAKTLRGNPIVARYREEDKDFTDHGEEITINDKGVNFKVLTRPYGFVDLNAKVWFEDFDDVDENGQILRHTYMVTEGMIWTHAYEELKNTIMKGGRPQSMELDPETIQGEWTNKINPNYEIFIINDAVITKLCALGENTEPCFIGSSIVPIFSELEKEGFVKELLDFKTKFNLALKNKEGGNSMETQNTEYVVLGGDEAPAPAPEAAPVVEATPEPVNPAPVVIKSTEQVKEDDLEISSKIEDKTGLDSIDENDNTLEEFAKKDSDEEEKKEDDSKSSDDETGDDEEEQKKKASKNSLEEKYALLEQQFNDLQDKCSKLEEANASLVAFKAEIEDKEKDALINSFYMLSDEDKKEVIENKSKYTLDDIEKELSVICVRKKVNFNLDEETPKETNNDTVPTTFNIDDTVGNDLPAWLKAVENHRNEEE